MRKDFSGYLSGVEEMIGVAVYIFAYVFIATVVYLGIAETGILDDFNVFTNEVVHGLKNRVQKAAMIALEGSNVATLKENIIYRQYEYHHIVPKKAGLCEEARAILKEVGIDINSSQNLIILEYGTHRHFHTNAYYKHVNNVIKAAFSKRYSDIANRMRVEAALAELRLEIQIGVWG